MKNRIKKHLLDAGYSEQQIKDGAAYANKIGYGSDLDKFGQLVLSRILYDDEQLESGVLVSWETREGGKIED